jgi:alanine-synthesizing transaminase
MITPSRKTANFHYAIRNLQRAADQAEQAGKSVVYLNIGDPQRYGFRPPDHVIEAVDRALYEKFTGYAHSAGLIEAREAVASYAEALGTPTTPNDVLLTSGSSEAADMVLTALVEDGDEVLVPSPGYPLYPAILSKLGAIARYYTLDEATGWQPSVEEIRRNINSRTRAIILINPNNPTGSIIPDSVVRQILELSAENKLLVIADEVYRELCFTTQPKASSTMALEIGVPHITLESLSKTCIAPGWRVGWMRYTHAEMMPELIKAINRLADGRLCSATPTQYAVQPALEGDKTFLKEFVKELRVRRDLSVKHIKSIEGLTCVSPDATFYMMVKVNDPIDRTDERFVLDLLEETGVFVVHGSGFGTKSDQGFFRLVFLPDEQILDKAFAGISRFLASCHATALR